MSSEMSEVLEQASHYRDYAHLARTVHYHMADWRAWINQLIGGLTVLASALVSTGVLTNVKSNPGFALTLAAGIVAFVAAVLAGLQTFYKFGEVAEKHRTAAADYGEVRRELELFLVRYAEKDPAQASLALTELGRLAESLAELDRKGPGYPGRLYKRAQRALEQGHDAGGSDRSASLSIVALRTAAPRKQAR
jgi:SMODS and SLOG-associating 2TM effector domain family 4